MLMKTQVFIIDGRGVKCHNLAACDLFFRLRVWSSRERLARETRRGRSGSARLKKLYDRSLRVFWNQREQRTEARMLMKIDDLSIQSQNLVDK